jgi:glucose-1-phosphate cytidylyltransferase
MTLTAPRRRTRVEVARPRVAIITAGDAKAKAPAPLTQIGGRPILWHTMMHFAGFGMNDFVLGLGRHAAQVKRCAGGFIEEWNVDLVDTGNETMTGGRLRRLQGHLGPGSFLLTTGDGVSDIDIDNLLAFHRSHGRLATAVAVRPPARFGRLEMRGDKVVEFTEKPAHEQGWTSANLYVLEPGVFDYLSCDETNWDSETLQRLAADGQLMAYRHQSFWGSIETLRDRQHLEELWRTGNAPWKSWK